MGSIPRHAGPDPASIGETSPQTYFEPRPQAVMTGIEGDAVMFFRQVLTNCHHAGEVIVQFSECVVVIFSTAVARANMVGRHLC